MRLMILLPFLIIAAIAGYNFINELQSDSTYYMVAALHAVVTLVCLGISSYIVGNAFRIKRTEIKEPQLA
ncbi:hypothetical protein ACLI1A_14165 [Flavobacterium sp. RHBU_3]|uniref:hypothetical protein n=1 Tax=Flavobacterium sp. RHBU_3 TaxID=3391184 RepID=UPI0039850753